MSLFIQDEIRPFPQIDEDGSDQDESEPTPSKDGTKEVTNVKQDAMNQPFWL